MTVTGKVPYFIYLFIAYTKTQLLTANNNNTRQAYVGARGWKKGLLIGNNRKFASPTYAYLPTTNYSVLGACLI